MTQENLRQLAKQGNPKALATIINQSLKPKEYYCQGWFER
jgi:hypothetical protein